MLSYNRTPQDIHDKIINSLIKLCIQYDSKADTSLIKVILNNIRKKDDIILLCDNLINNHKQLELVAPLMQYMQRGDKTAIINALAKLIDVDGWLNSPHNPSDILQVITKAADNSHSPLLVDIFNKFIAADLCALKYDLAEPTRYDPTYTLRMGLNYGCHAIIIMFDKLPTTTRNKFKTLLHKHTTALDNEISSKLSNVDLLNVEFARSNQWCFQDIKHVLGHDEFPKLKKLYADAYHKSNSYNNIKQINKLSGKEQHQAIKSHGDGMVRIINAIKVLS
jgi:hypothetical protein